MYSFMSMIRTVRISYPNFYSVPSEEEFLWCRFKIMDPENQYFSIDQIIYALLGIFYSFAELINIEIFVSHILTIVLDKCRCDSIYAN